jgi:Domain of unknown function (DUF5666)
MNHLLNHVARHPLQTIFKLACVAAILTGCGGGGSGGTTGSSMTSFAYGPISGFGSIIVNGVRFDDSSSSVSSEDDDDNQTRHSSSDLKLGMVVAIQGGSITSDDSGHRSKAGEIRFGSELVGPVGPNPDATAKTFTLLGQTVQIGDKTIFDNSSVPALASISDIKAGDVLEVHGLFNTTSKAYDATRIERKTGATLYKIRGVVADWSGTTFKIGTELISYPAGLNLPSGFANGQIVRVKLQTVQIADAWVATRIKSGVRSMGDHSEAEVKGTVTDFKSKSDFKVNGISVDATNATIYPSSLGNGAFVEVEGSMVADKLMAKKVTLEDSTDTDDFEFHGRVVNLNAAHTTFEVHSVTVTITDRTAFARTTQANLAENMCVEVKTDAAMNATYVKADNDCAP